jgi:exo-beta-1,3-glucanase (GH17 family)
MDGNQYHAPSNGYTRDRGQEGLMPQGGYHQHPGGRGAGGGGGGGLYDDGPYSRPRSLVMQEPINPNEIVDDGDDGFGANPQRRSLLSVVQNSSRSNLAAAGAATSATVLTSDAGGGGGGPGATAGVREKSEWLEEERHRKKRLKWIIVICVIIVLCLAGAGAALGVILPNRNNGQSAGSGGQGGDDLPGPEIQNAADDTRVNGDLDINSGEIKALMDDPDLHRIFPGIDYTPWGTQYPLCMKFPPSQNNITRDMAVLSQLSNVVRLYGTDCNQTEMVLHAIDKLQLTDMKLWMGVWIDTNTTTNERQLEQMYKVLDSTEDLSVFKGVIIGNEFLYRGFQTFETLSTLSDYISSVRGNFSERGIDLPIATSDLGDAWTSSLVELVDVVMANVHPFFGGIPIEQGAGWTYTFWSQHNAPLTEGTSKENIIAEVGWPTGGGNNCSPLEQCPDDTTGAVSGVDELNKFMEDWVCQALDNGTNYFWYVSHARAVSFLDIPRTVC